MQFYQSHRDTMGYTDHGPMWYMPSGQTSSHLLPAPPAGRPSPQLLPHPHLPHAPFGAQGQHQQPVTHPVPHARTRFLSTDSSCPDGEGEGAPESFLSFTPPVSLADLPLAAGQEQLAIPPAGVQAALEALTQSGQLLCSKSATGKPLKGAAKVKAQAKTSAALLASAQAGTLCITALLSAQGLASLGMGMGMCPTEALVRALAEMVPTSGPRAVPGQAVLAPASPSLTGHGAGLAGAHHGGQAARKASFALGSYPYEGHGYGHAGGGQLYHAAEAGHPAPVSRASPHSSAVPALHGPTAQAQGQGQASSDSGRHSSHAGKGAAGQQTSSSGPSKTAGAGGKSSVAGSSSCTASSPTAAQAQAQGEARRQGTVGEGEERPSHLMHVQSGEEGFTWGRLLVSPSAVPRRKRGRGEGEEDGEEEGGAPIGAQQASPAGKKACSDPRRCCPYSVPYTLSCVTDSGPLYTQWTSYRLKTEVLSFTGRATQGQGQDGTYLLARAPQLSQDGYDQYQLLQASVLGGSDSRLPLISLLHHLPMPPSPGSTYALPVEDEGGTGSSGRMLHATVQACEGIHACLALDWCDLLWMSSGVQVRAGSPDGSHTFSLRLHSVRPLAHTPAQWKGTVASQTHESDDEEHRSLAACSSRGSEGGCGQGCSPRSMHTALVLPPLHQGGAPMHMMTSSRTVQGEEEMDARSLLSGSGPGSPAPFSSRAPGLGMGVGGGAGGLAMGGDAHGQEQPVGGKERDTLTRDRTETVTDWPATQAEARA